MEPTLETCSPATCSSPPSDAALPALNSPPTGSGCPPPLVWSEVLRQFRDLAQPFSVAGPTGSIQGTVFGTGAPLYFLNGWSGDSDVFCLTAWLLRDHFRCVIIDYPANAIQFTDLSQCVLAVADELGDRTFNLFGTGFGSSVAVQVAATTPERIQNLILQGPIVSYQLSILERICGRICAWFPPSWCRVPLRQRLLMSNHRLWFPPFDHSRWQFLADKVQQTPVSVVARRFLMLNGLDLWSRLPEIKCPTIVVTSEGDTQRTRDVGDEIGRRLSNARVEFISNSGQVPYMTHPHRLANLIKPLVAPPT